jgi:hypothetical protein
MEIGTSDIGRRLSDTREVIMDPVETQGKVIIAAALIVRGAVEVPAIPTGSQLDSAGLRLRELTDYVYRLLTIDDPRDAK